MSARPSIAKARATILDAALATAGETGWTPDVLRDAIVRAGIDAPLAARALPRGVASLVEAFHQECDARMEAALAAHDVAAMRLGARVELAIHLRIEAMAPHRVAARKAIAFHALPQHLGQAARSVARTSDCIWRAVGDRAHDFSFYTKRATLGGVYAATVLVWLGDDSADHAATWTFLRHRLADVAAFGKARGRAREMLGGAVSGAFGALAGLSPWASRKRSTGWRETRSA